MTLMTDREIIDAIEVVRIKNNRLWMQILRLAVASRPGDVKRIVRKITQNDLAISELTARLAE